VDKRSFAIELDIARARRSKSLETWAAWIDDHEVLVGHVSDFLAVVEASGLQPGDVDDVLALVLDQLSRLAYRAEVAELLAAVRRRAVADVGPAH
jgi:hypothetical protein